ncbi:Eukaryotic translation initiation factor 3 subunit I [Castilleja foliolosa]|uniref:Eukaryotic translation initiation factor 3 subunit I n=1 Tax=Castilleja foliolosa TaxID=1961234 RepID=A0ABD3D8W9_9LAMI
MADEPKRKKPKISRGDDDYMPGNIILIQLCNFITFDKMTFLLSSRAQTKVDSEVLSRKPVKLWDSRTLKLIKTYERLVNAVAMSPLLDRVVLGGGQDASSITTTYNPGTKFQTKLYDKILTEEIGVKGHFGPINAL